MKLRKNLLIRFLLTLTILLNTAICTLDAIPAFADDENNPPPVNSQDIAPVIDDTVAKPIEPDKTAEEKAAEEEAAKKALKDAEAKVFYKDVEAIVKKHLDLFYQKGGTGVVGIYIKELNTEYEYDYNGSKLSEIQKTEGEGYFMTASAVKLMAAAVVYYLNNNNELEIDKQYEDTIIHSKYNMKQLTYRMITHSVNGYFNTLLRHFGSKKMNEVLTQLGTKNTFIYSEIGPAPAMSNSDNIKRYGICRSPRTTPKDLGFILDLLYDGKTFGEKNSKYFADSLKNNIYSNRLPLGIAYKSPVGHKTGTAPGSGVYNDAGIIYLEGNPYIMVVMSYGSKASIQATYRAIAKDVYAYMSGRILTIDAKED